MKNKILILALASLLSSQAFSAVRFGSFYIDTDGNFLSGVKDMVKTESEINIFEKTQYKPDTFYNMSAEEIDSTLKGLSDESRKKSYLNFLINDYKFNFENKDKIKFVVNGNNNIINFNIYLNDEKYVEIPDDDLGFKKIVCASNVNKAFLNNGARFEANYYLNDSLIDQRFLEGEINKACAKNFAPSTKKKEEKIVAKLDQPKVELLAEEKKTEDKTKTIYIPPTLIHNNFKYENGKLVEEKESDFTVVKIEEPKVEVKRVPQIVTLSSAEQQKILDLNQKKLKSKQKIEKINDVVNNINNIYKDLVEEDKPLFREHVASLMKKYYEDILSKKKKTNNNSNTEVSNTNEKVVFTIKFSRNYSAIAKESVEGWKKSNEAKKFVCSDKLLSSMLEIGLKYEVKYSDFRGTTFYSEQVDDTKDCQK